MVGVIPVMVIATVAALDEVPDDLRPCARTLGATRAYTLWHVQIRAALPTIVTGMRIAMGGAWSSIVAAEMIAATSGVGCRRATSSTPALRSLVRLADPSRR